MLKTFEFRLYPTKEQEVLLNKHFGATRWVYNWALNIQKITKTAGTKLVPFSKLQAQLPKLKSRENTSWLNEINSQSIQCSLGHLKIAFNNYFKKRSDYPTFKKFNHKGTFELPQGVEINLKDNILWLPKFKTPIRIVAHKKFEGAIRTCTVKKSSSGKYFISVLTEDEKELPVKKSPVKFLGIDLGLTSFLTTSTGVKINNPKYFKKFQRRLTIQQRRLSKKKRNSALPQYPILLHNSINCLFIRF